MEATTTVSIYCDNRDENGVSCKMHGNNTAEVDRQPAHARFHRGHGSEQHESLWTAGRRRSLRPRPARLVNSNSNPMTRASPGSAGPGM